jgi:5'-AMP-activated protein kinase catalytic alpha subunit
MSISEIRIGQYRFSKNLGNGSFGKVRMAFHEQTGHKVAIKMLNKKKIRQYGVFEKVKRELKILRRFNNPHTIKLFEFIDTQSEIFMVLEYAAGGELFDLIARRERLSEDEARKIFQQIISSIEYSHQDKIAHRDLKPENLLLDENHNIRLIDFGLANIMRDSIALKTACGSPNYAAPEVISGMSYGGAEVDVWSCGVILYAMVCGSLPFDDDQMP